MPYSSELVEKCLQFEQAFCTAVCPFNLDVRDFIGKLQQGRFNVAYRTYQNAVGFPYIVSTLCSEPCRLVCPMKDSGGTISIRLLERASIDYARNTEPDHYNIPPKYRNIAIIGAGISGMACALRLVTKKYSVTVYEKSERIGGHLYSLLPPEIFLGDINRQFRNEQYTLCLNTEIVNLDELDFDAVYVATGRGGTDFGSSSRKEGVFKGGSLSAADTMHSIAQGLNLSVSIEKYLKTGIMSQPEQTGGTKLQYETIRITPGEAILPGNGSFFSKDEALAEAKRCLRCACDACVWYSPLMNYFKKFPGRIAEEVKITIDPSSLDGQGTVATRLISTCNHCGLCKEVCPVNIDVGRFLLQSHREMHEKGAMPWAFHDFYLRDMEFSDNVTDLTRLPQGFNKSRFVFFPGCQLGASDPRYVTLSYRFLIEHYPDTALMLHCCGAPADWAGDEAIHSKVLAKIRTDWTKLGKPKVVFACPMCRQMFKQYLPEIDGEFLYSLIEEEGIGPVRFFNNDAASVFDPCASRYEPGLQHTVRELAAKAGFNLEPLPMEGKLAECCSYGGQVAVAYPPYATNMVKKRIEQSDKPYITYCANCRDIFSSAGKQTWHILDIIFGLNNEKRVQQTVSERRNNRLQLKHHILKEFWKENAIMEKTEKEFSISPELKEKLNKALILENDIYSVIESCEHSGRKVYDPEAGTFSGHIQIGNMTYWAEYRVKHNGAFDLINAYCHRMKIEE